MPRARTKRLPELFMPTWVVVPFAASTAAAGLYLVWVHRGQKEEAKEPLNDKLAERFSQFFKRETTTWRDLKQARTEITQTLRNILETV